MSADESSSRVSLIIPTRNRPADFQRAVNSALQQSYNNLEIICVDDGSDDAHYNQYQEYLKSTPENVQMIRLPRRPRGHGSGFARNIGIQMSSSPLIAFLDDDDEWTDSGYLTRAVNHITVADASVYFANQQAVTHAGDVKDDVWLENLPAQLPAHDPRRVEDVFVVTLAELLPLDRFAHLNCWIIDKRLLFQVGGFDESLRYEPDRDLFLKVIDRARIILYDRHVVAKHNIPIPNAKKNVSTRSSHTEKLIFQLSSANSILLTAKSSAVIQHVIRRKGYLLRHLAIASIRTGNLTYGSNIGAEAFASHFSIKWCAFLAYVHVGRAWRKLIASFARR